MGLGGTCQQGPAERLNDPITMSEERRPPVPAPLAPSADPAFGGDTPREGTPAFGDTPVDGSPAFGDTPIGGSPAFGHDTDEILVSVAGEPPFVGPAPDYASEYVPPRELPKPVEHKTIENIPVRIAPEADPRRAQTQKAMRVLEREEAQRHLMLMGVDATAATSSVRPSSASFSDAESSKSRAGLLIGGAIVFLVLVAVGFIVVNIVRGDPEAAAPSAAPPTAAAPAAAPTPRPSPAPLRVPEPSPEPTTSARPAKLRPPDSEGMDPPEAPIKRKPKPVVEQPKPINE